MTIQKDFAAHGRRLAWGVVQGNNALLFASDFTGEHWPLKKRILSFAERLRPLPSPRNFCCWPMVFDSVFLGQQFFQRLAAALQLSGDLNPPDTEPCHICQRRNVADHDGSAVANVSEMLFKLLAVVFITGIFLFGRVIEYRLWYEILPLGWMMISEAIANRYQKIQGNKAGPAHCNPPQSWTSGQGV